MKHLAIFDRDTVEKINQGKKSFELRVSQRRIPPFGQVQSGDVVLVKVSGGKLVGQLQVGEVLFWEKPKKKRLGWIKRSFGRQLCLPADFWKERETVRYLTLMEIAHFARFLTPPTKIQKRDRRGWVVLGETYFPRER